MFENLRMQLEKDNARRLEGNRFYIAHGYYEKWNPEHREESDNGLRRYSTDTRWEQYQAGTITREKAVELATRRMEKQEAKEHAARLARLDAAAAAPELLFLTVNVTWSRSRTWGYNPTAYVHTNNGTTTGTASGCGYDKESAAVASAFNLNNSILRELYAIKEAALEKDKNAGKSKTACTGYDNRDACGYGAGYSVLPYFEGGVGINCFWHILERRGWKVSAQYGKSEDFFTLYKEEGTEATA